MTPEQIAIVCHETNRTFCQQIGDNSQPPWDGAAAWQRESAVKGVEFKIANPNSSGSAQHDAWVADKVKDGWQYGPIKDPSKKLHPCIVPYDLLPDEQKAKDALFVGVVNALKSLITT